ncbi:MAG: hypothetical protein AAF585_12775 [Verrucomicrobiota bacterium]
MKMSWLLYLVAALVVIPVAATESWRQCAQKARAIQADPNQGPGGRQYAPDRVIDVKHLKLDLDPDFQKRKIDATATVVFSPIAKPIDVVKLDAIALEIHNVESSRELQSHHAGFDKLSLIFEEPIPAGEETTVMITYSAEPQDGLFFRTLEMGYKEGDTHL